MVPENLLVIATLLPMIGFGLVILFGSRFRNPDQSAWFTVGVMTASFACSAAALVLFMGGEIVDGHREAICVAWNWLPIGGGKFLQVGPYVDEVTVILFAMVSLISLLVHVYSVGYMDGDPRQSRFMAYLQLFTFSMLGIVLANSLLQLFVFWELVGLTSYLLIGFWYERRGPQLACKKAFVMNRIGDTGFLIGLGIIFYQFGGDVVLRAADGQGGLFGGLMLQHPGGPIDPLDAGPNNWWLTIAGLGLFMGAMGKSAQFPLHTWLPDAMEGPTPVSSIVHSATMVAAGVYLTARIFPILTPQAHLVIATVGVITLVMAAIIAMAQTDIKRVLAYSTLSQLGYMVLALGVGAYAFALFHLITHAFFKCCLFQCSGSVINAAHHEHEMPKYGGLIRKMPLTALAFGLSTLAIAGASIPWTDFAFSAYYSKDGIIAGSINYGQALGGWGRIFFWAPVAIAYITPFYMMRAFTLTFLGKPRDKHLFDHAHEAPWTMTFSQLVLAFFAVVIGWSWFGVGASIQATAPAMAQGFDPDLEMAQGFHGAHSMLLYGFAWMIPIVVGYAMYIKGFAVSSRIVAIPGFKQLHTLVYHKFGFDGLYDILVVGLIKLVAAIIGWFDQMVVDGIVNLAAWLTRQCSSLVGRFDDDVVDGAVRGSGRSAARLGGFFHAAHSGNIRFYVLVMIASVMTLLVLVIPFAFGWFKFSLTRT